MQITYLESSVEDWQDLKGTLWPRQETLQQLLIHHHGQKSSICQDTVMPAEPMGLGGFGKLMPTYCMRLCL